MTLEEKAKKLASSVPLRKDIPFQDYIRVQLASMYYTGAVENAIVWHDLRKNPKDLPRERVEVLNEDGDKVMYDVGGGQGWITYSEYYEEYVEVDEPIAWCEIPKYMKED